MAKEKSAPATSAPINKEEEARRREIENLTKDQRTVFVSQLTAKTNEGTLRDFFEQIGPVNNVIMLRDKATGRHKGFAYVELRDLESIENCLLFNNVVPDFQKFPILVKASEAEKNFLASKEKSKDGSGADSRVYLGNLHPSVTDTDLQAILVQFGSVDYVNLHRDEVGNSKGFAFARFSRAEDAQMAMEKLSGLDIGGKMIKVGPVIDPNTKLAGAVGGISSIVPSGMDLMGSAQPGQVYQATASWKLDDDEGQGMQMNSQSRAMLMAKLGQAAGIAVPVPAMPAIAMSAVAPQVAPTIAGVLSRCFMIQNMFDVEEEKRGEPGWELDIKEDVSEECGKFGPVEHCFVESRKNGGFVFIKMSTTEASLKAAENLNGRYFAGRLIALAYIDPAQYHSMF